MEGAPPLALTAAKSITGQNHGAGTTGGDAERGDFTARRRAARFARRKKKRDRGMREHYDRSIALGARPEDLPADEGSASSSAASASSESGGGPRGL